MNNENLLEFLQSFPTIGEGVAFLQRYYGENPEAYNQLDKAAKRQLHYWLYEANDYVGYEKGNERYLPQSPLISSEQPPALLPENSIAPGVESLTHRYGHEHPSEHAPPWQPPSSWYEQHMPQGQGPQGFREKHIKDMAERLYKLFPNFPLNRESPYPLEEMTPQDFNEFLLKELHKGRNIRGIL